MVAMKRPAVGLALGSGGAKGLAHIGVIKVLKEHRIPIDYIAGTSIGALVGAYYAAFGEVESLEKLIYEMDWKSGFYLLDPTLKGGLFKGRKIESFLKGIFKDVSFKSLKIPFTAVATDLVHGVEVDFSSGDLLQALRASISVPFIFRPVKAGRRVLTDGGLTNPVPFDLVQKMGADFVIAVNLDTHYFDHPLRNGFALPDIGIRSINILRYQLARKSLAGADNTNVIVVDPKINERGLIGLKKFFSHDITMEIVKAGERAARLIIEDLKRRML